VRRWPPPQKLGWEIRWVAGTVAAQSIPLGVFAQWADRLDGHPLQLVGGVIAAVAATDQHRRFHALQDKVYREDVLWRAWVAVRANNGASGIDKTTLAVSVAIANGRGSSLPGLGINTLRAGSGRQLRLRSSSANSPSSRPTPYCSTSGLSPAGDDELPIRS
jgi:hypothetical protein